MTHPDSGNLSVELATNCAHDHDGMCRADHKHHSHVTDAVTVEGSDWLARHDADVAAQVLHDAAERLRGDYAPTTVAAAADWLDNQADALTEGGTDGA